MWKILYHIPGLLYEAALNNTRYNRTSRIQPNFTRIDPVALSVICLFLKRTHEDKNY
jgi:hypothetical protein